MQRILNSKNTQKLGAMLQAVSASNPQKHSPFLSQFKPADFDYIQYPDLSQTDTIILAKICHATKKYSNLLTIIDADNPPLTNIPINVYQLAIDMSIKTSNSLDGAFPLFKKALKKANDDQSKLDLYHELLKGAAHIGDTSQAIEILGVISTEIRPPIIYEYTLLLTGFLSGGHLSQAKSLIEDMEASDGVALPRPTLNTYLALLEGILERDLKEEDLGFVRGWVGKVVGFGLKEMFLEDLFVRVLNLLVKHSLTTEAYILAIRRSDFSTNAFKIPSQTIRNILKSLFDRKTIKDHDTALKLVHGFGYAFSSKIDQTLQNGFWELDGWMDFSNDIVYLTKSRYNFRNFDTEIPAEIDNSTFKINQNIINKIIQNYTNPTPKYRNQMLDMLPIDVDRFINAAQYTIVSTKLEYPKALELLQSVVKMTVMMGNEPSDVPIDEVSGWVRRNGGSGWDTILGPLNWLNLRNLKTPFKIEEIVEFEKKLSDLGILPSISIEKAIIVTLTRYQSRCPSHEENYQNRFIEIANRLELFKKKYANRLNGVVCKKFELLVLCYLKDPLVLETSINLFNDLFVKRQFRYDIQDMICLQEMVGFLGHHNTNGMYSDLIVKCFEEHRFNLKFINNVVYQNTAAETFFMKILEATVFSTNGNLTTKQEKLSKFTQIIEAMLSLPKYNFRYQPKQKIQNLFVTFLEKTFPKNNKDLFSPSLPNPNIFLISKSLWIFEKIGISAANKPRLLNLLSTSITANESHPEKTQFLTHLFQIFKSTPMEFDEAAPLPPPSLEACFNHGGVSFLKFILQRLIQKSSGPITTSVYTPGFLNKFVGAYLEMLLTQPPQDEAPKKTVQDVLLLARKMRGVGVLDRRLVEGFLVLVLKLDGEMAVDLWESYEDFCEFKRDEETDRFMLRSCVDAGVSENLIKKVFNGMMAGSRGVDEYRVLFGFVGEARGRVLSMDCLEGDGVCLDDVLRKRDEQVVSDVATTA